MKANLAICAAVAAMLSLAGPRSAIAAEAAAEPAAAAEPKVAAAAEPKADDTKAAEPAAADAKVEPAAVDARPAADAKSAAVDAKPAEPKPAAAVVAKVDPTSPVGKWKTVDDSSGKAKSIVEIWEEGGKVYGKITALLDQPPDDLDPLCTKCEGDLKDKRIIGMTILKDLKKDGTEWSGGKILDPDNGKNYKCYIEVQDGGKKLKVRGYVGFALLGRTQYWQHAE